MIKLKQYIVHLQSFVVVARDEDDAYEKAEERMRSGYIEYEDIEYDGYAEPDEEEDR